MIADLGESRQLLHRRAPGPFGGERADVHLVEDLSAKRDARARAVAPRYACRIDDLRRAEGTVRLIARRRVGEQPAVEAVAIRSAGADAGTESGVIAVGLASSAISRRGCQRCLSITRRRSRGRGAHTRKCADRPAEPRHRPAGVCET